MSTTSVRCVSVVDVPRVTSRARENSLWLVAIGCCLLGAVLAPVAGLDQRTVGGINVWMKPLKFLLSFGIFSTTMAWLLGYLSRAGRVRRGLGEAIATIIVFEVSVLLVQAARGKASHFNTSTVFDAAMFYGMGGGVIVLTALLIQIWRAFGQPLAEVAPPLRVGIRAGLALFLLGTIPGWTMIAWGAHTVGAIDGGPGLPWLNWSVEGGDLRIAHFLGLHALQVLPLWGALVASSSTAVARSAQRRVTLVAVLYGALIVVTYLQALAGDPLLGKRQVGAACARGSTIRATLGASTSSPL